MPLKDSPTDEELIAAINAGESNAFEAIYFRYRDRVLGLAYRFTQHHDDSLDVLQETFAYFFGKFPGFILTANLMTFLYPAIKNLSLAARRKRLRASGNASQLDEVLAPSVPEYASELAAVLSSLSEDHREIVLMRFVDGLTLEEIAEALGVPLGTVKSRLHHALKHLRDDPRTRRYFL